MCFSKPGLAVRAEEAPGNLFEYPHGLLCPFSLFSVSLRKDHRDKCIRRAGVVRQTVTASVAEGQAQGAALANQVALSFATF